MIAHSLILAAEDEESDALLLQMALQKSGLSNRLIIARDGQEAVEYLNGERPYDREAYPLPDLVLLDLKMPRLSGFDVLEWLGTQPKLQHLPVVVLSSSSQDADIEKALRLGAREYRVKPHDFQKLTALLRELSISWLSRANQVPMTASPTTHIPRPQHPIGPA